MDWDMIGAIGNLLGGAAVVVSLVYLALQIRHSTRQSNANAAQATLQSLQAAAFNYAREENRVLLLKGCSSYRDLSDSEKWAFHNLLFGDLIAFNQSHTLHRQGHFPDAEMRIHEQWIADLLSTPGGREYWALKEHWLNSTARAAVDDLLRRGVGNDFRAKLGMRID